MTFSDSSYMDVTGAVDVSKFNVDLTSYDDVSSLVDDQWADLFSDES